MRHCVNDVRKGRQFLRRPMYRPAIPTAPKCDLRPHFGAGTQVLTTPPRRTRRRIHNNFTESLKNAERLGARSMNSIITAATQWNHHCMRLDRIEHRATVHTLSVLKTNTIAWRSIGVLIERRGRRKVTIAAQ